MSKPYRLPPLKAALFGAVIGLGLSLVGPKHFVADATVYFPSINSTQFKQLTQALKVDPANAQWSNVTPMIDSQVVEAACVILRSRAAVQHGLTEAKVTLPSALAILGDPIENMRQNDIQTDVIRASTVRVSVSYPRADAARTICQSLLDYYTNFVHDHRLTNTARTREQLEKKLARVDRRLTFLENKLTKTAANPLGELVIRPDSKTLRDIWTKRILERGSSQRVLEEMRRARKESGTDRPANSNDLNDEDWTSRWGPTAQNNAGLPNNVRQTDIPSRLELERVYEETLLLYHSALLQHDFLSTWEGLENYDYELVDPVSVRTENLTGRMTRFALSGAALGILLALLMGKREDLSRP